MAAHSLSLAPSSFVVSRDDAGYWIWVDGAFRPLILTGRTTQPRNVVERAVSAATGFPRGRFQFSIDDRSEAHRAGKSRSSSTDFSEFFDAYLTAAFWSSMDESDEQGGRPMDENYGPRDLGKADLAEMRRDAKQFAEENAELIAGRESQAGHDFWLTRNGHGAGFWDGDWPEPAATTLTNASKVFGEQDLYLGDKKRGKQKVHVYPPPKARKHTLKMRKERATRAKKAG